MGVLPSRGCLFDACCVLWCAQESGRAGRDGSAAVCAVLYRPTDVFRQSTMVFAERDGLRGLYEVRIPHSRVTDATTSEWVSLCGVRQMVRYCEHQGCRRAFLGQALQNVDPVPTYVGGSTTGCTTSANSAYWCTRLCGHACARSCTNCDNCLARQSSSGTKQHACDVTAACAILLRFVCVCVCVFFAW